MFTPILLVEDEPNDVFFMRRALKNAGIRNPLQVVENGKLAIDYLSGAGEYADRARYPLPCIVLLDMKLPLQSGVEVLQWIRQQPSLKSLIVIVLTSSKQASDVDAAYRSGANSYLVKPPSAQDLLELVRRLKLYWLDLNQPPPACA